MSFENMEATMPMTNQLGATHSGPVVLVNTLTVALEDRVPLLFEKVAVPGICVK